MYILYAGAKKETFTTISNLVFLNSKSFFIEDTLFYNDYSKIIFKNQNKYK